MVRHSARRGLTLFAGGLITAIMMFMLFTPAAAVAPVAAPLCGDGSAPDYGFNYDLQQPHWTVGWQGYASQQAVTDVDGVLDQLDTDSIAQTMILILPQDQVGNRVNCAVHFLRYMQLGLTTGEHKDNGFVFLIVVEPTAIDVHYGVGLGLPALTASDLTTLNRAAEAAYQPAHDMDQALQALVQGFDTLARSKYAPLLSLTPTSGRDQSSQQPAGPLDTLTICGQVCFGLLFILFVLFGAPFLARRGISINPGGFGSRWGGGGGSFGGGRGGSGSGRSGRGN